MPVWGTQETTQEMLGLPRHYSSPEMQKIYNVGDLYYGTERLSLKDTARRLSMTIEEAEAARKEFLVLRDVFQKRMDEANLIYKIYPELPEAVKEEEWNGVMFLPTVGPGVEKEIIVPAWNDIIHLVPPPRDYSEKETAYMEKLARWRKEGWSVGRSAEALGITSLEVDNVLRNYDELRSYQWEKVQRMLDMQKSPTPEIAKNLGTIMTAVDDVQDFTTTVGVIGRTLGRVFKPAELLAIGAFTVGEFLNRLSALNRLTGGEKAVICHMVKELKKSSSKTTIKADVDKRMKRLFPSKGELIEIAQTTDTLFGVGISFGPLVGLIEDAFFGAQTGAPLRFKEWKMSDKEKAVLLNIADRLIHPEKGPPLALKDIARWAESAANVIMGGESLGWNDFATGLVTTIYTGVKTRALGVKEAFTDIWQIMFDQKATPKKKTKTDTRLLLSSIGVDPYGLDAWPVPGLGAEATIQEIMEAYSAQAQKVLEFWRAKVGVSDEGLFLDACVKEIGLHAPAMFCADDGVITESLDPHALIFIHALEAGLNPPPDTSVEKFTEWITWIRQETGFLDISVPDLAILQDAHRRFFEM